MPVTIAGAGAITGVTDATGITGAWTSYTPTVAQGVSTDISKTVSYSKYVRIGKLVVCNVRLSLTAAGTTGSDITVTLPVTASGSGQVIGTGFYERSTTNAYIGAVYSTTTGKVGIAQFAVAAQAFILGGSFAAASGDIISLTMSYEAA